MKKIILIVLLSLVSFAGYSQLPALEDFEGATFPPTGWLVKDNLTNAAPNWDVNPNALYAAYSGTRCAYMARATNATAAGVGVLTEEWLITPQQTVAANSQLRFFTRQTLTGDTGTKYRVMVSSSADQTDLTAFTQIIEYTETDLSTLTADQLDYEEKVINLAVTGAKYFAFVKVYTQPVAGQFGDRWLVDDVKLVLRCTDPSVLGVNSISATGATLTWTDTATTQFEIEYGVSGFTPGTGTLIPPFTSTTTPRSYTILPGTLSPSTDYQFYVRAICPASTSEWIGPFLFPTTPLGSTCAAPIPVTTLPYSSTSNTSVYGNNINPASPGATGCGTTGAFMAGNDVVYTYTPTTTGLISISMNPQGATNTGVFVYNSCASVGVSCIGGVADATSNVRNIPALNVTANTPIYIVLSSTAATASFGYNLIIQQVNCVPPANLSAGAFSTTSGTLSWTNGTFGTSTSWEVAVQPAGSPIPAGAGTQTNINTNFPVTGLTAATPYQYWVRADCGNGTFSGWSGPFLFNTTICDVAGCNYTFILSDTFGDGWNNGTMQVRQNGIVVGTLGAQITGAGPTNVTVPMCNGLPFDLFWNAGGTFPTEMAVTVQNSFGQTLFTYAGGNAAAVGTTLYSGNVDCINPLCLAPTTFNVPNGQITTNGARITWTNPGVPTTGMGIYVVLAGSPPPTAGTPPTYTTTAPPNNYTITTGLLADTTYDVYIQTICSVNSPSVWVTTPVTFTTLPTCPRPTALTTSNITTTSIRVGWTNPTGTAWQVLALPAGSPAPTAASTGWVVATGNPFTMTGLTQDTAYDFYVRSDCGAVNGISTWSLPITASTLPTCPKPINLAIASITDNSAVASWVNPTGSIWQVLVLPAGSAAPTAASTGWTLATTSTFTLTGLSAATCYDYYVRTDCGAANGLSSWSGPINFCTTICNPANQCPYTFTMTDSFGDGWNGATMQVRQNGIIVATIGGTFTAGAGPVVVNVPLCTGVPFDLNWNAGGTFPGEVRVSITNIFGQVLYNMNAASAGLVGTVVYSDSRADCLFPKCLPPSNLSAVPGIFNAALDWTPATNNSAWDVFVVPTGGAAPTLGSTPTYPGVGAHPFTTPNTLSPNTTYDYYVRSLCGTGTPGDWIGPFTFTTLPTCPQPTNLHYVGTSSESADLAWNEVGPATSWNIMVQTSGGPAPGPTSGCVVTTLPTDAAPYNTLACFGALTPGFYEFYVRANCTGTDLSAWSGPINFYISAPLPACADINIDVVTTSPGQIDFCPGDYCIDLSATFTDSKDTTDYTVLGIPFAPPFPFTGGNQLNIAIDDIWGPSFTLPFDFCFYGVNYPSVQVGSNGVLTFTPQTAPGNCPWAYTAQVPATNFPIRNAIYGVYQDLNPSVSTAPIVHSINYQVLGTAPCRSFVVNFDNVAQFSCGVNVGLQTSQIVLYETSNIIEVYVQDRTSCTTWNSGSGLIGLQNDLGTIAHVPPGRNTGAWEAHNEAWRFTPDGNSTVEFSWLRDGVVVSNNPTVNVCFNQDTNMTAQAVYTGCGGTVTTKTENILLNITTVNVEPIAPVFACTSYVLPALTVGNYYTLPGGPAGGGVQIPVGTEITTTQTIYVFAELTTGTAVCSDEENFTVTIGAFQAPVLSNVSDCFTYTLQPLTAPFNYYTQPNGAGTMYSGLGGDVINASQTLYVYGVSGTCTAESSFIVSIGAVQADILAPVSQCNSFALQPLSANNSYYTQPGGPTGTGTALAAGDVITSSQTVYIYAQSGACSNESSFAITINTIADPVLATTQPLCPSFTGTVQVTSPTAGTGTTYPNLIISEVTDADAGSLTYVELFNGTAAAIDLSGYKLKVYNNGNASGSCDLQLAGNIAANTTHIVAIGSTTNVGGITPDEVFASCGGVNTNDNIRLTTATDVEIDLWGATDGTDFTPAAAPGYVYRRNSSATAPSLVWNPADWTALDPEDYSNVGTFSPAITSSYTYSIDGVNYQNSTVFTNLNPGVYTITAQDTATGCISNGVTVTINPTALNPSVTTFDYPTPVCISGTNPAPGNFAPGFTINGTYTSTPGLDLDINTGVINLAGSTPGTYVVTYAVTDNNALCYAAGSYPFTIVINPVINPSFAPIANFCSGTVAPTLVSPSPLGITGSWSPATIDNVNSGSYVFTPDAGQCSTPQTLAVTITARTQPDFAAIADFCSGATAPSLGASSPNGVSGVWTPATISNTADGSYLFTPTAGLCANTQTLAVHVIPNVTPDFAAVAPICSGAAVPTLGAASPNGVNGTWLPPTISNTADGSYVFTPSAGQCAVSQTLAVTVTPPINLLIDGGCDNGTYVLTVSSDSPTFNAATATYQWVDSTGATIGTSDSVAVSSPGTYTCNVTNDGCVSTTSDSPTSVTCTIQKGISPRGTGIGDGKNDFLKLACKKLEIFNRYGMVVYSKNNYSNDWYGQSDSGSELPDGTYFYVVEQDNAPAQTGWIYINREQ
ncbi:MAG: putative adhesin [Bacteroidota bacterium]|jgi:gliding motility-associated-like protein